MTNSLQNTQLGFAVAKIVSLFKRSTYAFIVGLLLFHMRKASFAQSMTQESAELVGPTANKLPDSLREVGVEPEQITDIFLTHIHPDDSGGLMEGSKKVFPNAILIKERCRAGLINRLLKRLPNC